jgi:hypothetical protein
MPALKATALFHTAAPIEGTIPFDGDAGSSTRLVVALRFFKRRRVDRLEGAAASGSDYRSGQRPSRNKDRLGAEP